MDAITYRNIGGTWALYRGAQIIWEAHELADLLAWARENGLEPRHDPIRLAIYR